MVSLNLRRVPAQDLIRLDQIAEHLNLKCQPADEDFVDQARKAVLRKVSKIAKASRAISGEQLLDAVSRHFRVKFETVRSDEDVQKLQTRYLREQKELGFAMLDEDLAEPGIDALLYQLENEIEDDPTQFVAVLNLRETGLREYWNKGHELTHRIAEPPQLILPLRRHPAERQSPVERLVDIITGDIVFYGPLFRPLVEQFAKKRDLTLPVVRAIRDRFAPSASLLSTANAIVKYWPVPAMVLVAQHRGRRHKGFYSDTDAALRVDQHSRNASAEELGLGVFPNMRVPPSSPLRVAFEEDVYLHAEERLGAWVTSRKQSLINLPVLTSAERFGKRAYAVVSLLEHSVSRN